MRDERYSYNENIAGDEAIWNHLDYGPKGFVNILKEKRGFFFCIDAIKDMLLLLLGHWFDSPNTAEWM